MTTTNKDTTPDYRKVTLVPNGQALDAQYSWRIYRFLLSNGDTIDVKAVRDDSDLRAAVLAATNCAAICGVATLPLPVPEDPPKVSNRVARKSSTV